MPGASTPTLDIYAPLSHKGPLKDGGTGVLAPMWVGEPNLRRLTAYRILAAYRGNSARIYAESPSEQDERREYGDARLLIDRVVAGVIGEDWQIVVDGADDDLPDEPDLPDRPPAFDDETPDPANPDTPPARDPAMVALERRIHEARMSRWLEQATQMVDEWEAAWASQPELQARQDWLRQWAEDEFFGGKIQEAEGDAVGLGDGVYILDLNHAAKRVRVTVYDPGFYFPVLGQAMVDWPGKIHVAWEYEDDGKRFVRRLTWELVDIAQALFNFELDDFPRNEDGTVMLAAEFERTNPTTGVIERLYPWARDDTGKPLDTDDPDDTSNDGAWSSTTCIFSDGTWQLKDLGETLDLDDFDDDKAVWAVTEDGQIARRLDKQCDFIPVVHVPNTPATREHFGESILLGIAQVLDDLQSLDTDRYDARELAALPAIALSGGTVGADKGKDGTGDGTSTKRVRPGVVWNLPEHGDINVLDMTKGLEQLRLEGEGLLDRMNVNVRVPAEVLGRVKASDVPSGIALALGFGPFTQLVGSLRLTRDLKDPLLLKFVQRLSQVAGWLPPGATPTARIARGAFLPTDLKGAVEVVVALLQAHGISRRTALQMLVDAGIDIGDLVDELDRITEEDTTAALDVMRATGSKDAAADRLGVDLPDTPTGPGPNPIPTLPPIPTPTNES